MHVSTIPSTSLITTPDILWDNRGNSRNTSSTKHAILHFDNQLHMMPNWACRSALGSPTAFLHFKLAISILEQKRMSVIATCIEGSRTNYLIRAWQLWNRFHKHCFSPWKTSYGQTLTSGLCENPCVLMYMLITLFWVAVSDIMNVHTRGLESTPYRLGYYWISCNE